MANVSELVKQLHQVRSRVRAQLNSIDFAIKALNGTHSNSNTSSRPRVMSAAGRKRIAAAQRARWAKLKAKQKKAA
jgi:hypothetical protein